MAGLTILHLMNNFADASIGRIVLRMVRHLGSQEYRWTIGALDNRPGLQDEFRQLGATVVDFSAGGVEQVRRYSRDQQVDIIHSHTIRTILTAARALGPRPAALHIATKHILTNPRERRRGLLYALADWSSLYLPHHLVAVSETMRGQIRHLPGLNGRVSTIRNAIDCEHFHQPDLRAACRAEFGVSPGSLVIGFNGRIVQAKRIDLLIGAFARLRQVCPDARLLIAGDGDLQPQLARLAHDLELSSALTWTGFRQDVPYLLAGMDIFVQPSVNEGLSLSLLEAMAAGKAVIATRVGGTAEVLTDSQLGMLISPGSTAALAGALETLALDPDRRCAMARRGQEHAFQNFHVTRMMDSYHALYQQLAAQRGISRMQRVISHG